MTGAFLIAMLSGCVADALAVSVALTVKFVVPDAVGVPLMVLPFSVRPAGRAPLTLQVKVPVPPVALSDCE